MVCNQKEINDEKVPVVLEAAGSFLCVSGKILSTGWSEYDVHLSVNCVIVFLGDRNANESFI